ncbi:L,D-transpeptidase [Clostridium sp. 'White wine YQ']|uniref:L,D-transpeptidase n=1 Tax=Clostridium sp. 'White wine YQ' TaxID=3027474 RepID=UPI00236637DB|nr:L,D-transpeptidase [Clostridium sp. 'White wine YQ']MDD7793590.1 L,D-transpeptidase [Clostridium sp. 'White wine YQ']
MKKKVVMFLIIICALGIGYKFTKNSEINSKKSKDTVEYLKELTGNGNINTNKDVNESFSSSEEEITEETTQVNKEIKNESLNNQSTNKSNILGESQKDMSNISSQGKKNSFPTDDPIRAIPNNGHYTVKVKINEQKIYVYNGTTLIRAMSCSTGIEERNYDTPLGHYKINGYFGQSFFSNKYNEGARYWVGFIGSQYLFHSVPTGANGQIITSEAEKIGKKASHGCIRMSVNDAYWFYETIPQGSDVVIEN